MKNAPRLIRLGLLSAVIGILLSLAGLALSAPTLWHAGVTLAAVGFTVGCPYWPTLKNYQFTFWIISGFIAAMVYASNLVVWGGFNITNKWIVIFVVQATMFSMGTKISIDDFIGVIKMPKAVFVGALCQFTIMPLVGFGLTRLFNFPPEIAMGIILIGSCASGLSSNVMAYIANANLALSVSITAVCTLLAAIMTPLWVNLLGSSLVSIQFTAMVASVIQIVIVPIGAALLHDYVTRYASAKQAAMVEIGAILCGFWLAFMLFGGWQLVYGQASASVQMWGKLANFLAAGIAWSSFYTRLTAQFPAIIDRMPMISMIGIIFFTTTAAAGGRDNLLNVGGALIVAMLLHNLSGYGIGYLLSRYLFWLNVQDSRTIAIEVGLQNGGMASGLAASFGKLATMGLASAVVTPIGNVSGSILANYWRKKDRKQHSKKADVPISHDRLHHV